MIECTPLGASSPLAAKGLTKRYSSNALALAGLDLEARPGEIVGLLGRNGAGKSSAVRLIVGLEQPTAGEVRVFGCAPSEAARRNRIGYCSQDIAIYPSCSIIENLTFFARLAGFSKSDAAAAGRRMVDRLGLAEHVEGRSSDLSGGFKRRLHLGIALIGGAPLLVLDEPTAGVDVESRELIIDLVRMLADSGRTVIYTSHDLTEVERLCDRLIILSRGVTSAAGTVEELSTSVGQLVRLEFEDRSQRDRARYSLPGTPRLWGSAGLDLQLDSAQSAAEVMSFIQTRGWRLRKVEVLAPGLESIFLQITRGEDEAQRPA